MENFSHFAFMASIGMIIILLWRLNNATRAQSDLAGSVTVQTEEIEKSRLEAEAKLKDLTESKNSLEQENLELKTGLEQSQSSLAHLQTDHETLQSKYGELEQDLLSQMADGKKMSTYLQEEQIEKANLQRRLETLQERQITQQKGAEAVQADLKALQDKNHLYQQAVQAAKEKIDTLEKQKKQLERDLQQALYQVVELEQNQPTGAANSNAQVVPPASSSSTSSSEPSLPSFG